MRITPLEHNTGLRIACRPLRFAVCSGNSGISSLAKQVIVCNGTCADSGSRSCRGCNSRHSGRRSSYCRHSGRRSSHSRHSGRRCCHRRHSGRRSSHSRHSGRGSHYRIERRRVCDDRRHSGRRSHYRINILIRRAGQPRQCSDGLADRQLTAAGRAPDQRLLAISDSGRNH